MNKENGSIIVFVIKRFITVESASEESFSNSIGNSNQDWIGSREVSFLLLTDER
jgi:hypothetical protein